MLTKSACLSFTLAAIFATGCQHARPAASMAVYADTPVLTLGAGDSLGRTVYVNDLIIAAREANQDVMLTEVPVEGPMSLDE